MQITVHNVYIVQYDAPVSFMTLYPIPGWHKVEPRRRPHAILRDMGSSFSPNDGIGTAWSQSEELGEETANKRAFSSIEAVCRIS